MFGWQEQMPGGRRAHSYCSSICAAGLAVAILSVSFDKTGSQKCFEGKIGFIVPAHFIKHPCLWCSNNLKGRAEVKIINKRNHIDEAILTVLPSACQESSYTSSQTLCGLNDKLSHFFFFLSTFHPLSLSGSRVWIRVTYSCINITVIPQREFISPGL